MTTQTTKQALDASEIIHTGWIPSRDVADQCGVNVDDFFDLSGRFLGPDQNGIEPTFEIFYLPPADASAR